MAGGELLFTMHGGWSLANHRRRAVLIINRFSRLRVNFLNFTHAGGNSILVFGTLLP